MIELIQFPYSPFCIVQRRILEYARAPYKTTNIPPGDRSAVWKLTRERYYQVPVLRDGRQVIFETGENSQVIAKYLDQKLQLDLFPAALRGLQDILWSHIESEIEGLGFKLNDIFYERFVPKRERWAFVRHKERKFGRGCLRQWREQRAALEAELGRRLVPFEGMLMERPFLLRDRPSFVDFDLFGMLANFLYTKEYELPPAQPRLGDWYSRMARIRIQKPKA